MESKKTKDTVASPKSVSVYLRAHEMYFIMIIHVAELW